MNALPSLVANICPYCCESCDGVYHLDCFNRWHYQELPQTWAQYAAECRAEGEDDDLRAARQEELEAEQWEQDNDPGYHAWARNTEE